MGTSLSMKNGEHAKRSWATGRVVGTSWVFGDSAYSRGGAGNRDGFGEETAGIEGEFKRTTGEGGGCEGSGERV